MSRLVSLRRRLVHRPAKSRCSSALLLFAVIVCVQECLTAGTVRADEPFAQEPTRAYSFLNVERVLANLSAPTLRVYRDHDREMRLEDSQLRTIDVDDVLPTGRNQNTSPRDSMTTFDDVSEAFTPAPGSEWVGEPRPVDSDFPVAPLREDGDFGLYPVRRLSIPNPLKLIGNPFRWGGRFRAEWGSNFDDYDLIRGNLIVNSGLPIGFDTEVNYRNDDVRTHHMEDFWSGDFNVIYRFGQIRYAEIRAGFGFNWLARSNSSDFGFNATYGMDFHLRGPWLVSTVFDWGTIGSEALLHMQFTTGLEFNRFEVYVGYDFYEIGSREWKSVIAGVGLWF